MIFADRREAGERLAAMLGKYPASNAVVLALPRGGVPVAKVVSDKLGLPLGLVVVRKIGHRFNPEYAIAAISESGALVENEIEVSNVEPDWYQQAREAQIREAKRRRAEYWGDRPVVDLLGKTAIIVDDGLATGLTMEAAIEESRGRGAQKVVVAVPVAPTEVAARMREVADDFIAVSVEEYFGAVGAYYKKFDQVSDQEVVELLR